MFIPATKLSRWAINLLALSSVALAHPGNEEHIHPNDLPRRQLEANDRHVATAKCAREITQYNAMRRAKRNLIPTEQSGPVQEIPGSNYQIPDANQPSYKTIQNNTCVLTPETAEGPYFVGNELLRNDVREKQLGVDLLLDIGVMDIRTCKPLPQALVEIWAANATGFYSSFTLAPAFPALPLPASTDPAYTDTSLISSIADTLNGKIAGNKTDEMTFLRGAYPTNQDGMVEFKTIYPGFYTGRTVHIHTIVTTNWTYLTNGTVVSKSGNTRHMGQIFFDEELNDQVLTTPVYKNTPHERLPNYRDGIFIRENANGYNAFAEHKLLGDSVTDGVLAYITIGVDTQFETPIYTNNTWEPTAAHPGNSPRAPLATSANKRVLVAADHE